MWIEFKTLRGGIAVDTSTIESVLDVDGIVAVHFYSGLRYEISESLNSVLAKLRAAAGVGE